MSNEEQDAAIGRALRDYGATNQKLAAHSAEVFRYAKNLRKVANYLVPVPLRASDPSALLHGGSPNEETAQAISSLPTADSLGKLIEEIKHLTEEKRRLRKLLEQAGMDPKDDNQPGHMPFA
jgi:hypothetical protein